MELLVFGHGGTKVLVFPTRDGRFHEYEDIRMVETIAPRLENGELQLFCVDSVDHESFYCFWCEPAGRVKRHNEFEAYILHEVIPFMNERNPEPNVISHGCSLGAFHAVNVALRHPALFTKVVAFSGRYDLTWAVEGFSDLFDGYYDQDVYFHNPSHYLPNLECETILEQIRALEIVLVVGDEDPFVENNRQFSDILAKKNIKHQLHIWQGRAHKGHYWRRMVAEYL